MTDTLKRVAETLADHGQREAATEVADISLLIKAASTGIKTGNEIEMINDMTWDFTVQAKKDLDKIAKKAREYARGAGPLERKVTFQRIEKKALDAIPTVVKIFGETVTASTSKQAEGDGDDHGKKFADLLKKGGMQVKYNAKTDSGTASGSGISLEFSPSGNDGGVWVEVTMRKFKAASGEAADAVLDMVKAVRKVY